MLISTSYKTKLKLSDNSVVEEGAIIDYSVAQNKIVLLESPNRYRIITVNNFEGLGEEIEEDIKKMMAGIRN